MDEDINFLRWLVQRLVHLHRYDVNDTIIIRLNQTIDSILSKQKISIDISDNNLDKILSKYYADFYLDKTDSGNITIGYDDNSRSMLRNITRNLIEDVINLNIPKEPLIKG